MLLDGKKVACATCIKGHRATHCKHKDRPLVEIKKIGRPATQCERCRALRLVRQLHVKCNCGDERKPLKRTGSTHEDYDKKKRLVVSHLRTIAPRQKATMDGHQQQMIPSPSKSCCNSSSDKNQQSNNKITSTTDLSSSSSSCCGSQSTTRTIPPPLPVTETTTTSSSSSSSSTTSTCCPSTTSRIALGRPIRLVTCRCGDACTCIGCDAHPARAMKLYHDDDQHQLQQHQDPYAGYLDLSLGRRRLSIAAICQPSSSSPPPPPSPSCSSMSSSSSSSGSPLDDRPTSVLAENGAALLCGCGCSHALDQCTDCFQELCQDYFASR